MKGKLRVARKGVAGRARVGKMGGSRGDELGGRMSRLAAVQWVGGALIALSIGPARGLRS